MRRRSVLPALALVGAGCRQSTTEPTFRPTAGPVPAGLPVSARLVPTATDSLRGGRPVIAAAGDSVTVAVRIGPPRCAQHTVSAGIADGRLVVTSLSTPLPAGPYCTLQLPAPATLRAVVRAVPRAQYTVVVRDRIQGSPSGAQGQERELARGAVTVR